MKLPQQMQERIDRLESLEAKRTRLILALTECQHSEHYPEFIGALAETLCAGSEETTGLLSLLLDMACDAVEWPAEIPADRRP